MTTIIEYKHEILGLMASLRGSRKCVVADPEINNVIDLLFEFTNEELEDRNIIDIMALNITPIPDPDISHTTNSQDLLPHTVLYLVRGIPDLMKYVSRDIKRYIAGGWQAAFHIAFLPNKTVLCEQILEDNDVMELVTIEELSLGYFQIDDDLWSLQNKLFFKQIYIDGEPSGLKSIATALARIQVNRGIIPNIRAKGNQAQQVLYQYMEMRKRGSGPFSSEVDSNGNGNGSGSGSGSGGNDDIDDTESNNNNNSSSGSGSGRIDTMILLDRTVDLVSPLTTALTYEGLIAESIGIDTGHAALPHSILIEDSQPKLSGLGLSDEEVSRQQTAHMKAQG